MAVIHPGVFFVMKRFPERRGEIVKCFNSSKSFQVICEDYKQCSEALQFWNEMDFDASIQRKAEYEELLHSLENEIFQYVNNSCLKHEGG